MNKPYVKEYNEEGIVTNPIEAAFITHDANSTRKQRRAHKNKTRFVGNKKGTKLSVGPNFKYKRVIQTILQFKNDLFSIKRIEHYTLIK